MCLAHIAAAAVLSAGVISAAATQIILKAQAGARHNG